MILEQLLEKKDIYIYIDYRIKQLMVNKKEVVESFPIAIRHIKHQRLEARIIELRKLKHIIVQGELKQHAKRLFAADKDRKAALREQQPPMQVVPRAKTPGADSTGTDLLSPR